MTQRPVIDTQAAVPTLIGSANDAVVASTLRKAQASGQTYYACVTFERPAWEPLHWLAGLRDGPRVYWHGRWSDFEVGAAGSVALESGSASGPAHELIAHAQRALERCVVSDGFSLVPRAFFAGSFDSDCPSDGIWDGVPATLQMLPEATVARDIDQPGCALQLIVSIAPSDDPNSIEARIERLLSRYDHCDATRASVDLPRGHVQPMDRARADWQRMIAAGLAQIESGELRKIVLSRHIHWSAASPIPPWDLMRRVRAQAHGAYHIAVQPSADVTYVCGSPERLFRLMDGQIETECVAGTVARGAYDGEDSVLSQSLMASAKDRLEHNFVIEDVLESLRDLCRHADVGTEPWILRLPTVQHLVTTARGELRDGVTVGDVLRRLHPTPAVGGTPRTAAMRAIRTLEGRSRGWYAGPIGWVSATEAEFAVGIRSALVRGQDAHIFVGAGIVPGSTAAREWDETDAKAQSMLRILQP